jgi:hypothetical protein
MARPGIYSFPGLVLLEQVWQTPNFTPGSVESSGRQSDLSSPARPLLFTGLIDH